MQVGRPAYPKAQVISVCALTGIYSLGNSSTLSYELLFSGVDIYHDPKARRSSEFNLEVAFDERAS
jgi:hypothetical protein